MHALFILLKHAYGQSSVWSSWGCRIPFEDRVVAMDLVESALEFYPQYPHTYHMPSLSLTLFAI